MYIGLNELCLYDQYMLELQFVWLLQMHARILIPPFKLCRNLYYRYAYECLLYVTGCLFVAVRVALLYELYRVCRNYKQGLRERGQIGRRNASHFFMCRCGISVLSNHSLCGVGVCVSIDTCFSI